MIIKSEKKPKISRGSRALLTWSLRAIFLIEAYYNKKIVSRLAFVNKSFIVAALAGMVASYTLFFSSALAVKIQYLTDQYEDRPLPAQVFNEILLKCSGGVVAYNKDTRSYSLSNLTIEIHNNSSILVKIRGDGQAYRDGKNKTPLHIWPKIWSEAGGYAQGVHGLYPLDGMIKLMPGKKHIGIHQINDLKLDPKKIINSSFFLEYRLLNSGNWKSATPNCRVNIPKAAGK